MLIYADILIDAENDRVLVMQFFLLTCIIYEFVCQCVKLCIFPAYFCKNITAEIRREGQFGFIHLYRLRLHILCLIYPHLVCVRSVSFFQARVYDHNTSLL